MASVRTFPLWVALVAGWSRLLFFSGAEPGDSSNAERYLETNRTRGSMLDAWRESRTRSRGPPRLANAAHDLGPGHTRRSAGRGGEGTTDCGVCTVWLFKHGTFYESFFRSKLL